MPGSMALSSPRSEAGNASGSLRTRIATYCAVHSPIPGSACSRSQKSAGSCAESKWISPLSVALATQCIVSTRRVVDAEIGDARLGETRWAWGKTRDSEPTVGRMSNRFAVAMRQSAGECGCRFERNLLPKNRPHRQFKNRSRRQGHVVPVAAGPKRPAFCLGGAFWRSLEPVRRDRAPCVPFE